MQRINTFCPPKPAKIFVFILFLLFSWQIRAQDKFTISGTVTDQSSGEYLIGATIRDVKSGKGTVTNTFGFYSLTLPSDSALIAITYIGYKPGAFQFFLDKNTAQNISLEPGSVLREVEIKGERYERIEERAQMGRIDVPIQQIKNVPAFLGEKDVLKALQLLPGVSGGGEGQSGIYVRGGGPDQNLILLDGVPVYNVSHLFGFFSVFNPDAVKDVSLIKGGFPARYGGRLSSVIEINMKEGNENEFHGEGTIGLIASKLTLEGPIKKGKSSFIVSGRRTYIDILARPLIKAGFKADGSDGVVGYFFDDVNAKVNYKFSEKDRVFLSFYAGQDKFYFNIEENDEEYEDRFKAGLGWGNITTALRWNHIWTPKLFANSTLTFSRYKFETSNGFESREFENKALISEDKFDLNYFSGISDVAAKIDFDYLPSPEHYIRFGANAILHTFKPGDFRSSYSSFEAGEDISSFSSNYVQPNVQATEFAAYAEDDWKINSSFRVNAGLHFSGFALAGKPYFSLQPRLNARYLLDGGWSVKAGFSTMRQYIHLLTNETIGLPTDLWLPTTKRVKPQDSWQAAVGTAKTLGKDYEFSVELYYKEMNNVIAFREGSSLLQFEGWEDRVSQGRGTAYGSEFFVQKKTGKLSGWIGYTLSWATRQFDDINFGKEFPYKYDRRHDFEVTGSYKFTERFSLAASWVYSTGNAVTLGNSQYLGPSNYGNYLSTITHTPKRNNFRMPSYNRLDVGVEFTKKKRRYTRTWAFGAYNAYNRKNPFFLFTDTEYNNGQTKQVLKKASLFPVIPYFAWSFKF
ncbi:MAG TPA: TonB-dependent receptor plug domain-containing protein [Saprospiraceae bacterium]|nr:TonB-dependent receptor plug domain-containing protein [Saprospiraceae bacterium]HPI07893.1 TonB-dependent receptor plug domain-containing protein [Saprospiraceae bacterium]